MTMSDSHPFLVTATMMSLGASTLAPWLAYIAAADFFIGTYPNAELMFVFPVQNFFVLVTGSMILMFHSEKLPLNQRIILPQIAVVASLAVVPCLNLLAVEHDLALKLTLLAQLAGAVCVTVYQSASYGAGAMLGPSVTNSLETGKGLGGLGIILARMGAKAMLPSTRAGLVMSTNVFFAFSNCLVITSIVLWTAMLRDPYAAAKIKEYEDQRQANNLAAAVAAATPDPKNGVSRAGNSVEKSKLLELESARSYSKVNEQAAAPSDAWTVLRALSLPAGVVASGFMVCLSCFPGLTTSLSSRTLGLGDWFPVLMVFAYNTFDLVGKSLPNAKLLFTAETLPLAEACHLLFIPAFVLVARRPPLDQGPLLAFFGSDEFAFLLVSGLGLFTGYITCSAMMLGPGCVPKHQDRILAGQMMTCCLMIGLFAGSMLGVGLAQIA
mmetsp:Transcript_62492/g.107266  ORF Transcript_62492/g.107266 Transcript_62492/m.107266 type:complete len:439 (+) Transcript_62492:125-1441(+)